MAYLNEIQVLLQPLLTKVLAAEESFGFIRINSALRYVVLAGGKRFRPALVYATGSCFDLPLVQLHAAAIAIELIHCYSLVHDDLPAMDNDSVRRGQPTCHIAFGEANAILAGDALQAMAFEVLTSSEWNPVDAQAQVAMVRTLALAAGVNGLIAGQAADLALQQQTIVLDMQQRMAIHAKKTGVLMHAAVKMALALTNATTLEVEAMLQYAYALGLVFQLADDLDDEYAGDAAIAEQLHLAKQQASAALVLFGPRADKLQTLLHSI
jgi:farnesyl diphosphate synthase